MPFQWKKSRYAMKRRRPYGIGSSQRSTFRRYPVSVRFPQSSTLSQSTGSYLNRNSNMNPRRWKSRTLSGSMAKAQDRLMWGLPSVNLGTLVPTRAIVKLNYFEMDTVASGAAVYADYTFSLTRYSILLLFVDDHVVFQHIRSKRDGHRSPASWNRSVGVALRLLQSAEGRRRLDGLESSNHCILSLS